MFDTHVPHPKYNLNRYSTRQLYAWLEVSTVIAEMTEARRATWGNLGGRNWSKLMEARRFRRGVWKTLADRDEPVSKIARTVRLTKEDVRS